MDNQLLAISLMQISLIASLILMFLSFSWSWSGEFEKKHSTYVFTALDISVNYFRVNGKKNFQVEESELPIVEVAGEETETFDTLYSELPKTHLQVIEITRPPLWEICCKHQ